MFAEKDGYRFAGLKTTTDATDAVVTMRRLDEPPRPLSSPTAVPNEVKRQSAKKVLEILSTVTDKYVQERARGELAKDESQPG